MKNLFRGLLFLSILALAWSQYDISEEVVGAGSRPEPKLIPKIDQKLKPKSRQKISQLKINSDNCLRNLTSLNGVASADKSGEAIRSDTIGANCFDVGRTFLFKDWMPELARVVEEKYFTEILKYSNQFGLNPRLVVALITLESAGKTHLVSDQGAIGLMQVMPGTASMHNLDPDSLWDQDYNIMAGTTHLHFLFKLMPGQSPDIIISAYNCGENDILADIRAGRSPRINSFTRSWSIAVVYLSRNYVSTYFG